jgi:signal transduction histidine kinase
LISFSGFDKPAPWADDRIVKGGDAADQLSAAIFPPEKTVDHDELRRFLHDIRNPVGAILGFAHILENRDRISEEQLDEILAAIRRVTERLSGIIDTFSEEHR